MKKNKIFILFMLVLALTGCTTTYELYIDGDKFTEKITTYIYEGDRETAVYDDEATASRIDAFVDSDVYPFFENYENRYDKKVNKIENYEEVILKYKYKAEEYAKSNAVNLCFENRNFKVTKDYYNIDLSGYFYCLYDNNVLNIEIKTNNKVINHNAHEKEGNKYIWRIDKSNYENVNIKMQLEKENEKNKIYVLVIVLSVVIFLSIILVLFKKKIDKNNKF